MVRWAIGLGGHHVVEIVQRQQREPNNVIPYATFSCLVLANLNKALRYEAGDAQINSFAMTSGCRPIALSWMNWYILIQIPQAPTSVRHPSSCLHSASVHKARMQRTCQ